MELFEFRGEDITEEEDGAIIRRIITKGQGYSKPNEGASVDGNTSRIYGVLLISAISLFPIALSYVSLVPETC